MEDKVLGLLGLMRRAGAIELGEDNSAEAVRGGKAKIVIFASDVSDSARRKMMGISHGHNLETVSVQYTREELGSALGVRSCAMAVLTDMGFSNALMKELAAQSPEEYGGVYEQTKARLEKTQRRRKETARRGGLKRNVKRRTEV